MGPLSSTTRTDINCVSAAVEYVDCLIAEIWKLQLIWYFDEKTIINKYLIWYAHFFTSSPQYISTIWLNCEEKTLFRVYFIFENSDWIRSGRGKRFAIAKIEVPSTWWYVTSCLVGWLMSMHYCNREKSLSWASLIMVFFRCVHKFLLSLKCTFAEFGLQ